MREITDKELKKIQLDILDAVHAFCQAHHLTYFLGYGTLLGAIRHKGYIPWDDDIDICMPRNDYERFIKTFDGAEGNLRVKSYETDATYYLPFAKVENSATVLVEAVRFPIAYGVNIDIFPLDGVPDDLKQRQRLFKKVKWYYYIMALKNLRFDKHRAFHKNLLIALVRGLTCFVSMRALALHTDKFLDKHADKTLDIGEIVTSRIESCFPREAIMQSVDVEFEGRLYKTMAGYDEYLKRCYGNYMVPPPEKEQVTHHAFKAYWK